MGWIAQLDFVAIANALVILIVGLAAGLGWRNKGGAQPERSGAPVEVAGAIVDSSSVKQATIELSNLASATVDSRDELEEVRHSINRLREAIDRQTMEIARKR